VTEDGPADGDGNPGVERDGAAGDDPPEAYADLVDRVERHRAIEDAAGHLRWDQEVVMPAEGTPARARQLAALSAVGHDVLTDPATAEALDAVAALTTEDDAALDPERAAVVREVRREHDRAARVDESLVEELSAATSEAHPVWRDAKEDADFDAFAPTLERLVDLRREYAAQVEPDADPYAALFHEFEPCLDIDTAERILDRLAHELPPIVEAARADSDGTADPATGDGTAVPTIEPATQEAVVRELLDGLGYDWDRGRLDTAPHPFSSGTPFDARVTTRFDPDDPLAGITSTIHEFGHATYTQGLPREHYGTPLGEARDLTVHESQSRLWENHVGRSRAFWEWAGPRIADHAPAAAAVDPADWHRAATRVEPGPIRVEADELTYHLHIVLRFEIERDLIRGEASVADVPDRWRARSTDLLGVEPGNPSEGALQDIHWSHGSFGYFPTYTLGSVLAAQLWAAMADDVGREALHGHIAAGEFAPIREWLGDAIHRHGKQYPTDELVERATGEPLRADAFLAHVRRRYATGG
jgi:carboxypeptidase Taq